MARTRTPKTTVVVRKAVQRTQNRFAILHDEGLIDYFPLQSLPRELRDQIYEYMIIEDIEARPICKWLPWSFNHYDLRPMLSVSTSISKEFEEVLPRTAPHHIEFCMFPTTSVYRQNGFTPIPGPPAPTKAHHVFITNGIGWYDEPCKNLPANYSGPVDNSETFLEALSHSTQMRNLVVSLPTYIGPRDEPRSEWEWFDRKNMFIKRVVEVVEKLPHLKQYHVRCGHDGIYASRDRGGKWTSKEGLKYTPCELHLEPIYQLAWIEEADLMVDVGLSTRERVMTSRKQQAATLAAQHQQILAEQGVEDWSS